MIELTVTELVIIGVVYCVALLALAVSAGLIVGAGLLAPREMTRAELDWLIPPPSPLDRDRWRR